MDIGKNLALLFGAVEKPDEKRLNRITIIIDKAGKILKIDKGVNPSTHGSDLVDFFKTVDASKE